ncbi:MAG: hypothetical protein H0Z31_13775 [Bacillus sp. (in: Bacteria)]|nr:hypothetical protein [Bacillus sp. (in: firmicutes)]
MMWTIMKYEFTKVRTSPILVSLLVIFLSFNVFIIYQHSHIREELAVLTKLVDRFGHEMNGEKADRFKEYYFEQLDDFQQFTKVYFSKEYHTVQEFLEDFHHGAFEETKVDEEQLQWIEEIALVESYYYYLNDLDTYYKNFDVMNIAKFQISRYGLSGQAERFVNKQYAQLKERFTELVETNEYNHLFFIGSFYKMHTLLFRTLFRAVLFESIILAVLLTGYLVNFEFENKTHLLTYSSKRGRRLSVDKWIVSLTASSITTVLVLGGTFIAYFSIFDYSGLWKVPISSGFNWEYDYPYISWWNLPFVLYLTLASILLLLSVLIFSTMTYVIAMWIRHSYFVFFLFWVLFGAGLLLPSVMAKNSIAIIIVHFTPFILILNPFLWFMESGAFTTFKYYELVTVVVWSILLLIVALYSVRRFKQQDVY